MVCFSMYYFASGRETQLGLRSEEKKLQKSCTASNLVVQQTQCLQDTWHAHGDAFTSLESKILYACVQSKTSKPHKLKTKTITAQQE